jgi:hypothetical protein
MPLLIASTSSITTSPRFGGGADVLNAYLQTVDWLQGANNGGALFVKGMADICMGRPDDAASTHEQKMKETYKCPTVTPLVLL